MFPGIKNSNNETLPWWVSLIIILALIQTFGFFYLCFKFYTAHKRRKNVSLSSSIIASPKLKNFEASNANFSQFCSNENNTLNYALYPSSTLSSNYMPISGIINAYSPTALFNSKFKDNYQIQTLQKVSKCKYLNDKQELTNHVEPTAVNIQNKNLSQNFNQSYRHVSNKFNSNYREIDEQAAALAVASMSLTRPISRNNNFDPNMCKNVNNFDYCMTSLKNCKVPTLKRENSMGFNQKRINGESPAGSDLSTLSSSSASTNVTTLSFFSGDYDKKNAINSALHENLASGEEISIEFEGETTLTPAFQTFGLSSTSNKPLIHSQNNFLNNQHHLQNQSVDLKKLYNGMVISA